MLILRKLKQDTNAHSVNKKNAYLNTKSMNELQ